MASARAGDLSYGAASGAGRREFQAGSGLATRDAGPGTTGRPGRSAPQGRSPKTLEELKWVIDEARKQSCLTSSSHQGPPSLPPGTIGPGGVAGGGAAGAPREQAGHNPFRQSPFAKLGESILREVSGVAGAGASPTQNAPPSGSGARPKDRRVTIGAACACADSWLRDNPESSRAFFDALLRSLLQALLGLGKPKDKSWLFLASARPDGPDAREIARLLDPRGTLMCAAAQADDRGTYAAGFTFPTESVPSVAGVARTQALLRQGKQALLSELPHYQGRLAESSTSPGKLEVRLSLWEYVVSWLVFYAVQGLPPAPKPKAKDGRAAGSPLGGPLSPMNKFADATWGHAASMAKGLFSSPGSYGGKAYAPAGSSAVYKELMRRTIECHVDLPAVLGQGREQAPRGQLRKALFLLDVACEFWLSDANQCDGGGMRTQAFAPPSQDLVVSIKQLVRHLVVSSIRDGRADGAFSPLGPAGTAPTASPLHRAPRAEAHARQAVLSRVWLVKKSLYRLLLRCFLMWPVDDPQCSLKPVLDLWMTFAAPWTVAGTSPSTPPWQDYKEHVLSNMPFYASLMHHFLRLQVARAASRPESVASDVLNVLDALLAHEQSSQLAGFLRDAEADLRMHAVGSLAGSKHYDRLSVARHEHNQMQRFALAGMLTADKALEELAAPTATFDPKPDAPCVRMMQELLGALRNTRKVSSSKIDEAARMASRLFGVPISVAAPPTPGKRQDGDTPRGLPCRTFTWHDVVSFNKRYKGDWMRRPVASYELAFLVRALVSLSDHLNQFLGLAGHEGAEWTTRPDPSAPIAAAQACRRLLADTGVRFDLRYLAGGWQAALLALHLAACVTVLPWGAALGVATPAVAALLLVGWAAQRMDPLRKAP